jgi:hypothetical protein
MDKIKIKSDIIKKCSAILDKLPKDMKGSFLLTGGSAAFLYGSDRPFSNDIDFMLPRELAPDMRVVFDARFTYHKNKPVFHSFKTSAEIEQTSYDLIAESIVQPAGRRDMYCFHLTDEIIKRKTHFSSGGKSVFCVPKELLVLIKLIAGRGEEMKKYDLYDVQKILTTAKDFDFKFFDELIKTFCNPVVLSAPLLLKNAKKILAVKKGKNITSLVSDLGKLESAFI